MQVFINNQPTTTLAANLLELATELALPARGIAVALSNRMIPRNDWEDTPLTEGANIVIIKAACGG